MARRWAIWIQEPCFINCAQMVKVLTLSNLTVPYLCTLVH